MPVKRPLILTAVLVVVASAVHSQSVNPGGAAMQQPAPLFANAPDANSSQAPAQPATLPNALADADPAVAPRRAVAPSDGTQPWAFTLPKPPSAAPDDDPAKQANEIDLSALRYFASQNDLTRVTAEIRLLRAKHPGWEPPQDLFSATKSSESEQPLWDLFAKHDYEGVRAAMADLQQNTPDWQPSTDLLSKLTLAEANEKLVAASDAQEWGSVIDIAAANKTLLTCNYVDALWRTAEALVHTDDEARAAEAYRYILTSCKKPAERLATVQKASLLLKSPDEFESLMRLGRRLPSGRSEFESVRLDLIRQKTGDAAAGKSGPEASQSEIDSVAAHARSANDKNDQQLLGWYNYSRKDFVQAESWFRMALQPGPNPKAAEGLVLTLRAAEKLPEAERLALQYAPLGPLNRKLMVEVIGAVLSDPKSEPVSTEDLATFTKAIDEQHLAEGAQIWGWRLFNANDLSGAQGWFQKSAEWQPSESAALGLVVTVRRLRDLRAYGDLVAKYRGTYAKVAQFDDMMRASYPTAARFGVRRIVRWGGGGGGWDKNADAIAKTLHEGNYDQTLAMLEERKAQGRSEPAGLSIVRGWAMYHKGDWEGAKQVFASAQARGLAKEANEGLGFIQRGYLPPWLR
jgi:tetratricopeptide (TPR) repeat protein